MQRERRNSAIIATDRLFSRISDSEGSSSADSDIDDSEEEEEILEDRPTGESEEDSSEEENEIVGLFHNVSGGGDGRDKYMSKSGEEEWMKEPLENPNAGVYADPIYMFIGPAVHDFYILSFRDACLARRTKSGLHAV